MRPKRGRSPYLCDDCATCRHWLDRWRGGGSCRKGGGPAIEVTDEGRTCLSHVRREGTDWHALVGGNRGVDGL